MTIIYGHPTTGKSTWVNKRASPVIDTDWWIWKHDDGERVDLQEFTQQTIAAIKYIASNNEDNDLVLVTNVYHESIKYDYCFIRKDEDIVELLKGRDTDVHTQQANHFINEWGLPNPPAAIELQRNDYISTYFISHPLEGEGDVVTAKARVMAALN